MIDRMHVVPAEAGIQRLKSLSPGQKHAGMTIKWDIYGPTPVISSLSLTPAGLTRKICYGSKKPFNTIHANNFEFYHELAHVIEREPVGFIDPELRGLFASIGIEKGRKFTSDDRMHKVLL